MENLKDLVSVYTRYINSLKADGADIETNYTKMSEYIKKHSDEDWLTYHLLQDCHINYLRAKHKNLDGVEVSQVIMKLISTNCDSKTVNYVREMLVFINEKNQREIRSYLPTLYKYFSPKSQEEATYMKEEFSHMLSMGLAVSADTFSVVNMMATFKEKKTCSPATSLEALQETNAENEQIFKELKAKYFKRIEDEMTLQNCRFLADKLLLEMNTKEHMPNNDIARRLTNVIKIKAEKRIHQLLLEPTKNELEESFEEA